MISSGCPELLESEGFPQISLNLKIFLEFPWFWKKLLEFPWFWQISGFHALKKSANGLSCCTYALKKSIPRLQEIAFSGLEISKFSRDKPPRSPSLDCRKLHFQVLKFQNFLGINPLTSILRLQEIAFSGLEISKFSRDKPPGLHPKIAGNCIFRPWNFKIF